MEIKEFFNSFSHTPNPKCLIVTTVSVLNPVPVALINGPDGSALRPGGRLADLAPTLLQLMGLDCPGEMTGRSLLLP